jgi:amino acid adenylation domain-containing protein
MNLVSLPGEMDTGGRLDHAPPSAWNDTARSWPGPLFLHEHFEAWAARTPAAPALVDAVEALSYSETNARANRLARQLMALGVGAEVLVGVCMERSPALVVTLLAIWKSGGAYLPLDPGYPRDRLAFMLDDARPHVVVSTGGDAKGLPEFPGRLLLLDDDADAIAAHDSANRGIPGALDRLAYVIYTSGSTGTPKGVQVEHRGVVNLAATQGEALGVGPDSRILQFASPNFDASVSEIVMALAAGASLHFAPRDELWPGPPLADLLRRRSVTHVTLPPSALAVMAPDEVPAGLAMIVAGEASGADLTARWAPGRRLINGYGPTEATVCATQELCIPEDGPPPIGRPLANVQIHLLDAEDRVVPIGMPGEINIGGVGVARGYLGRPDLTAERFRPDPFRPGGRLYRTGDLGRYRPDGRIDFLGRIDQQVKIRGHRIELGEVEAGLLRHPSVAAAVVVARADSVGGTRLVAYSVPGSGLTAPSAAELRRFLADSLPGYMIPSAFLVLDRLPVTPNGKIDRAALPEPAAGPRAGMGPRDPLEQKLGLLWQDILGIDDPAIDDDFFALGGDSLQAAHLVARIGRDLGAQLPIASLLHGATIEAVARALRSQPAALAWSPLVALRAAGSRPPLYCVHPAGGTVLPYADLSRALGPDQPFHGLQALGFEEGQAPLSTVEAMATVYVDAIRAAQPTGPYHLSGWSFGAVVAFAMAQKIRAEGGEVGQLIVLDAALGLDHGGGEGETDIIQRVIGMYGKLFERDVALADLSGADPERRMAMLVERAIEARLFPADFDLAQARRLARLIASSFDAGRSYVPRPYPGRITLVRAREVPMIFPDETLGWGALAGGGLDLRWTTGSHLSMLRSPQVADLAACMTQILAGPGA